MFKILLRCVTLHVPLNIEMNMEHSLNCRVGHNEVIGVCRTGLDAEGLGRDHWNEMLAYHRKPITHWHPLLEVSVIP